MEILIFGVKTLVLCTILGLFLYILSRILKHVKGKLEVVVHLRGLSGSQPGLSDSDRDEALKWVRDERERKKNKPDIEELK